MAEEEAFPGSVEEAGALLGATITRCGVVASGPSKGAVPLPQTAPPAGMHSAFCTVTEQPLPSAELLDRLHALRALLRAEQEKRSKDATPLAAAPGLVQVLKKLVGISMEQAAAAAAASTAGSSTNPRHRPPRRQETPPLVSTPIRALWVDCMVLCQSMSGSTSLETSQFVRQMLAQAGVHPRSAKAAGGVRVAAFEVIQKMMVEDPKPMSLYTTEVLNVSLKALRSAGHGEPTYRVAAVQAACACTEACREAALLKRQQRLQLENPDESVHESAPPPLHLPGSMEERAVQEAVKLLRQAVIDKFPEVRSAAATLAAQLAPLLVTPDGASSGHTGALHHIEEVMVIAMKNLDDESPAVADGWANAMARCMSTTIEFQEQTKATASAESRRAEQEKDEVEVADATSPGRFGGRKGAISLSASLSTLFQAVTWTVDQFVKAGGELAASRMGGTFSTGGRAVRTGWCLVLTKLLRLQAVLGSIGESRSVSIQKLLLSVLNMLGDDMDKQLNSSSQRSWSAADSGLVRLSTSRVLRHGISEMAAEPVQITFLQELVALLPRGQEPKEATGMVKVMNPNQLQVILMETSNLLATLGEAAASRVKDLIERLNVCLSHNDRGVRQEAAVACVAMANSYPSEGRLLVSSFLQEIHEEHAQLANMVSSPSSSTSGKGSGLRMFRRGLDKEKQQGDSSLPHQWAIHGRALALSMIVKDLPSLPGGLPRDMVTAALKVAEMLVDSQFNEVLSVGSPESVCVCVRAGFGIISGVLATGPAGSAIHMSLILGAWQKACKAAKESGKKELHHDLDCTEALLASIVAFLKFCSELLLEIPEALSQITLLLEEIFALLQPTGRLGSIPTPAQAPTRLDSAHASLLEAFAWLPSGSFPMVADDVFAFAASQIRRAVEGHISCSILHSLVTKEDSLLDSKTLSRANLDGQVGGARDIEETIISLTAEVALHEERESVLHLRSDESISYLDSSSATWRGSCILNHFASDPVVEKAPTPLHEVGTWRKPVDPSCSSKVRLVDAAIQAFSATFGLKDGKEQHRAMDMLESLVPPLLAQLARTIGINAAIMESDRRSKGKDDNAAVANITAVLLSCLQALPLHEATHNVPIALGPPWMNKAKDLLLTLLPSTSTVARRAAAEGLALLATLGTTEDAHFLQSTLLHSLDEVMQGNKPDGKPRTIALEPVSAARAGSLLTLACIQRTAQNVAQRKRVRARGRISGSKTEKMFEKTIEELPVLQMMTRILPSVACHGFKDYFVVRTYALHSFAVLLANSARLDMLTLNEENKQLLRKGIELAEENFSASWTMASTDIDRGQEEEKMASEVAFLAALLRLMTFLIPFLHHLKSENPSAARRFSVMAAIIVESHCCHPVVSLESMAFFEVLAYHQELLAASSRHVCYSENPLFSCIPCITALLSPPRPPWHVRGHRTQGCSMSSRSIRAAVFLVKVLSSSGVFAAEPIDMRIISLLVASLEAVCGSRYFAGGNLFRSFAASREVERFFAEGTALESEIFCVVPTLLLLERPFHNYVEDRLLRWILFARSVLSGVAKGSEAEETMSYNRSSVVAGAMLQAISDTSPVYDTGSPVRWQVKCLAAQLASFSLDEFVEINLQAGLGLIESPQFDFNEAQRLCARECAEAAEKGREIPPSKIVFHLEDLVSSACMSAVATLDQAELRTLQESAVHFLDKLVKTFGPIPDPENPTVSILDQYSTQIYSAVKHALSGSEESDAVSSYRLFVVGCDTLDTVVESMNISDSMVLKRLIRPIVPPDDAVPFFEHSTEYPSVQKVVDGATTYLNVRASLVVPVGRLWAGGRLLLSPDRPDALKRVAKDLIKDHAAFAVHSAAVAIDACRLLYGSRLSLVGLTLEEEDARTKIKPDCGFLYRNFDDIDDDVKSLLARAWSSCCYVAVKPLLDAVACNDERRDACSAWTKFLIPLLIAGIHDGLDASRKPLFKPAMGWARLIDTSSVLTNCLSGLTLLVAEGSFLFDDDSSQKVESLVVLLRDFVLKPIINEVVVPIPQVTENKQTRNRVLPDSSVLSKTCLLLLQLSKFDGDSLRKDSALLVTLLTPLDNLQKGLIHFDRRGVDEVIATCLEGIGSLIRGDAVPQTLVKVMLRLVLDDILAPEAKVPNQVTEGATLLLQECWDHESLGMREKRETVRKLASAGNWDAWTIVAAIDHEVAAAPESLSIVLQVLRNSSNVQTQVSALTAIRSAVQNAPVPSPAMGALLHGVGADAFVLCYQYGTTRGIPKAAYGHRATVCADSMKIMLCAYQQIASDNSDDAAMENFLSIFFETLLAVLRFNGLPNHPSPEPDSDPALGRMSAQAIVHMARTTPAPFKSSMSTLSERDRALLEFAVRAEMSGYAGEGVAYQTVAPKRKLNIQGFKK